MYRAVSETARGLGGTRAADLASKNSRSGLVEALFEVLPLEHFITFSPRDASELPASHPIWEPLGQRLFFFLERLLSLAVGVPKDPAIIRFRRLPGQLSMHLIARCLSSDHAVLVVFRSHPAVPCPDIMLTAMRVAWSSRFPPAPGVDSTPKLPDQERSQHQEQRHSTKCQKLLLIQPLLGII